MLFVLDYRKEFYGFIKPIIDSLHIERSRHRTVISFQVNVLVGLIAYVFKLSQISVHHLVN
jgi:hypothetical protein